MIEPTPEHDSYNIRYVLRGGSKWVSRWFDNPNAARLFLIDERHRFAKFQILEYSFRPISHEINYISERQLFDRAFLQLECEKLGCE